MTITIVTVVNMVDGKFVFTVGMLDIGGRCVPVFVKSACDVAGTHSLIRFGQRTVSSPGASICW